MKPEYPHEQVSTYNAGTYRVWLIGIMMEQAKILRYK